MPGSTRSDEKAASPSNSSTKDSVEMSEVKGSSSSLEKRSTAEKQETDSGDLEEQLKDAPKLVYIPFIGRKVPRDPYPSLDEVPLIPLATASTFSKWSYTWVQPLMILGYQRPLSPLDLWKLDEQRESGYLADRLSENFERRKKNVEEWNAALDDGSFVPSFGRKAWWRVRKGVFGIGRYDGKNTIGLAGALSDTFFWPFWSAGGIKVIGDIAAVLSPLVTKALIQFATQSYLSNRGVPGFTNPSLGTGIGLAMALWIMQIVYAVMTHQYFFRSAGTGVLVRGALIASIYRKSMKLNGKSRIVHSNGALINHISTDVSRIDFCAGFFHMSWTALVQVAIIVALLIINVGVGPALSGIAFLFFTTPLQAVAMKKMFGYRVKAMVWTDKRAKLIQELLGGMRIIKFFAWEQPYLEKLDGIRREELRHVKTLLSIRALNSAAALSIPTLSTVIAFGVYSALGGEQTAARIFTSLLLFNLLRMPLMLLPMSLSMITDAYNGLNRLTAVFLAPEITETFAVDYNSKYAVEVKDASFQWESSPPDAPVFTKKQLKVAAASKKEKKAPVDEEKTADSPPIELMQLDGINLKIPRGSLTAVVGKVGSGKSSLLQALLGEMRRTKGDVTFAGSIAYCPQQSWIRNATLRENILFGQVYEEKKYQQVIKDSCLDADIAMLPNGELTEIGEKGINLSGGQRQRVNIARALYYNADIVLLDDPLSAVDAHVGKHLFDEAIRGALKDKTRILVTHGLHFLPACDYIICIDAGRITQQGTYAELMNSEDATFSSMITDFGGAAEVEEEKEELSSDEKDEKVEETEAAVPARKALMQEEERITGAVSGSVYRQYLHAARGHVTLPLLLGSLAAMQATQVFGSYWLVYWQEDTFNQSQAFYMGIYAALGVAQALFAGAMGLATVLLGVTASKALHYNAIAGVLRAPMEFFDTTPLGRIMNRFSKDIDSIDNTLNDSVRMALSTFANVLGAIILIAVVQQWFLLVVFFVIILYGCAALFYRASAREVKRIDNILRSSLYGFFSETLSGLATIRAYGENNKFLRQNERFVDIENRAYFISIVNQRWLGLRLDLFGSILTLLVAIIGVAGRYSVSPAQTGLILSYVLTISQSFSWMVRQIAEVENELSSVERVLHYANSLEQEAPPTIEATKPSANWPAAGAISIKNVVMSYREGLPAVLKDISVEIKGGEKIGVVGRTGAGKSSIMLALFRVVELSSGSITIDDVDISKLGLQDLRTKVAIIPQDALLFNGTIKSNLDPFGLYSDEVLWSALKRAWLVDQNSDHVTGVAQSSRAGSPTPVASRFNLELVVEDEGLNLSVGERSLVSLARALVKDSQIIVLDEATASVDYATDSKIQATIRKEFKHKTLLTIAHRLRTIINYDRVLVMSDGQVEEFDTPLNLYRANGVFHSMCVTSGVTEADIVATASFQ